MKKLKFTILFCFAILACCNVIYSATELWEVDGKYQVQQVVADGKGGAALICSETNSVYSIFWVDNKGTVIYEAAVSNAAIISCSNKLLVYSDNINESEIVQVDFKGATQKISKSENKAYASFFGMIIPSSTMSDKKGFFGVKIEMIANRQKLVRFSNK